MAKEKRITAVYDVSLRALAAARCAFERLRGNVTAWRWTRRAMGLVLAALLLVAYSLVLCRWQREKDMVIFQSWMDTYDAWQQAAAREAVETDPYTLQLNAEAELLARVLYGVRDNSTDDLKTYCWCVFNRVDNRAFPSTLADVIAQPEQWMRYDATNPVLENLYQVAREQLDAWHSDAHRPVDSSYVFMSWSARDICLRDNWQAGSNTHYWRWGQ